MSSAGYLALQQELSRDIGHSGVALLQERLVESLPCAHQPVYLQLLHTAVGTHAQLSARWAYSGNHETLELTVILES